MLPQKERINEKPSNQKMTGNPTKSQGSHNRRKLNNLKDIWSIENEAAI